MNVRPEKIITALLGLLAISGMDGRAQADAGGEARDIKAIQEDEERRGADAPPPTERNNINSFAIKSPILGFETESLWDSNSAAGSLRRTGAEQSRQWPDFVSRPAIDATVCFRRLSPEEALKGRDIQRIEGGF